MPNRERLKDEQQSSRRVQRETAAELGVRIVTGDTKVVDRGKGDGVFINTAGIGTIADGVEISPERVVPGDAILISGYLGRHGMAIMSVREGLSFEGALQSDCASLAGLVEVLLAAGSDVHCLRDLTRGGLAAFVPAAAADHILEIMHSHPAAHDPAIIGGVTDQHVGVVELFGLLGGGRMVDLPCGEQMPRIC